MEKFFNNINQLVQNEGINVTSLESEIGASQGVLSRAIRKHSSISVEWVIKLLQKFPLYDANWLLTVKGTMLKEGADAPHLEPKNWIEDDLSRYEGSHDRAALERVGLRLDEICKVRNISYDDLANLLEIERATLLIYIAGNKEVPASLLETLMIKMPEINPMWLLLGYGDIFNKKIIQ